jgi:hypothetical protein
MAKIKKLIIVLNFYGLTLLLKLKKMSAIVAAHIGNPLLVPGLTPAPADVDHDIQDVENLIGARAELIEKLKANQKDINDKVAKLENTFVSQYATQTQSAPNITASKVKLLGYDLKGEKEVTPPSTDENPIITQIVTTVHGEHTLQVRNNQTQKIAMPPGILRIDIYGVTGGDTAPKDIADLISRGGGYLGQVTRGKYVHKYGNDHLGTIEYYIPVYVDKASKKPFSQGPAFGALMT